MSDRRELHKILVGALMSHPGGIGTLPITAAAAILEAGWRKPRVIATVEELDALAVGSVILSEHGGVWERQTGPVDTPLWVEATQIQGFPRLSEEITLPAIALYVPEAGDGQ